MRLVVFGPAHPFRGGIAQTTSRLASELVIAGHEVRFLTARSQYPRWLYPGRDDVDPQACEALDWAEPVIDPWKPWSWPAARASALASPADVWILPFWTWAWSGWWRHLLRGEGHPPVVAIVHNPQDHDAGMLRRVAARTVLERCEGLFTHAEYLARTLRDQYPWARIGWHLLPAVGHAPVSDREAARVNVGVSDRERLAVFWGLIRPYKGVGLLLEAFARLPEDSSWRLIVAGEPWGGSGAELEAAVSRLRLSSKVRLELGWVREDRIGDLLGAADLVVLPYRSGSQSAVAPRALAAGVPVLTTRVGGLPELVRDDVDGIVVEPGSVTGLAEAIASLDDARLGRLRQGAVDGAGRVGWSGYADAVARLAARVVGRPDHDERPDMERPAGVGGPWISDEQMRISERGCGSAPPPARGSARRA